MKGGWHTSKYTNFKNKQIVGFTKQSEPNNYENKTTVTANARTFDTRRPGMCLKELTSSILTSCIM